MEEIRILTWNMHGQTEGWPLLDDGLRPTFALLQECHFEERGVARVHEAVRRGIGTAVISYGPSLQACRELVGRDRTVPLVYTYPGRVAIAQTSLDDWGPFTLISVHCPGDVPATMTREGAYYNTSMHRILSDLEHIVDWCDGEHMVLGGDFNVSSQLGQRDRLVHDRLEALGFMSLTKRTWAQRPPVADCDCGQGPQCGHYRTFRRSNSDWLQDDYLYVSKSLSDYFAEDGGLRFVDTGSPDPWTMSDHCPIIATFRRPLA